MPARILTLPENFLQSDLIKEIRESDVNGKVTCQQLKGLNAYGKSGEL
jgi:hypothetical protein